MENIMNPKQMVTCIQDVLEIKLPVEMSKLKTNNSRGQLAWDLLNTEITEQSSKLNLKPAIIKRTPWELLILFQEENGILTTLIRTARLKSALNEIRKGSAHYIGCLVRSFNHNIQVQQLTFIEPDNRFADGKCTEQILSALGVDEDKITKYIIISFDQRDGKLISVNQLTLNKALEVTETENLSKYISVQESVIADDITDFSDAANNPQRGLQLTPKATSRQDKNTGLTMKDNQADAQ